MQTTETQGISLLKRLSPRRMFNRFNERITKIPFVRSAIEERADLSAFRARPTPRIIAGISVIVLSYVIGWPAVSVLGFLSIQTGKPALLLIGGPLVYGISHLAFILGMYLAGMKYTLIFLKWATRVAVEKFLPQQSALSGNSAEINR